MASHALYFTVLLKSKLNLHNVIIRIQSVLNKDKNHCLLLRDIFRKMLVLIS